MSRVELNSKSLVKFNKNSLSNLTSMVHHFVSSKTLTSMINRRKHFLIASTKGCRREIFSVKFNSFVNLKDIHRHYYRNDTFCFLLLPNGLPNLTIMTPSYSETI